MPAYVRAAGGAVVWPEVEAQLGELEWVQHHFDRSIPPRYGIDPHVLHRARALLVEDDVLVEERVVLSNRPVAAWLDKEALDSRGQKTAVERAAAAKRRLYRTFLSWTGNAALCGGAAEQLVHGTFESLAGRHVWIPDSVRSGQVDEIEGRRITVGGPLDSAGHWAIDSDRPGVGFVPYAVEVKNLRSVIYPWSHETWDLLAKLGDFPDVVPILVARRLHVTTFRFFKDIGALGCQTNRQWFVNRATARASIDPQEFARVRTAFGFHDARLLDSFDTPDPSVVRLFSDLARRPTEDGSTFMEGQRRKWESAAPVVSDFADLRDEGLDPADRRELWLEFSSRILEEGLYDQGGWAPRPRDDDEPDFDEFLGP